MTLPSIDQVVGYVGIPAKPGEQPKIVKAKVLEVHPDGTCRVDFSEGTPGEKNYREKTAINAAFNEDKKTANTWHWLEEAAPAK